MSAKIPSQFVIQNFDKTFWGKTSPVADVADAHKFMSYGAADRRLGANRLAMLGATKATIREIIPTVTYTLVEPAVTPAETAPETPEVSAADVQS